MSVEISEKAILIRPSRSCREYMPSCKIYEYTRGVWRVSLQRAQQAEYAFCALDGKVVRVYRIDGRWHKGGTYPYQHRDKSDVVVPGRWEFIGEEDAEMQKKYLGESLSHYFPRGNQNPVKYINC